MKTILLITTLFSTLFTACQLESSYRYTEEFHSKYEKRLQEDPNYKLDVQDLNIQADIDDNSIFCYSTATTIKEKMQKLIEGLREIPIDCHGGIKTSGSFACLLENELLDNAAKELASDTAYSQSFKPLKIRALENGYTPKMIVGGVIVQDGFLESDMIQAVERKMKSDVNFCSYIVSKKTKDLGVGYSDKNGKRYWGIILGSD